MTESGTVLDEASALRGWRLWKVSDDGRLTGLIGTLVPTIVPGFEELARKAGEWLDPVAGGYCRRCNEIANPDCTCGVYAFDSLDALFQPFGNYEAKGLSLSGLSWHPEYHCIGRVAGWGRVSFGDVHWGRARWEDVWRSEWMRVTRLFVRRDRADAAKALKARWAVPVQAVHFDRQTFRGLGYS